MFELGLKLFVPATTTLFYHLIDLHWFSRFFYLKLFTNINKNNLRTINDSFTDYKRVGLRDLDIFFHMNNARYLWHMDLSRNKFLIASGLFDNRIIIIIHTDILCVYCIF